MAFGYGPAFGGARLRFVWSLLRPGTQAAAVMMASMMRPVLRSASQPSLQSATSNGGLPAGVTRDVPLVQGHKFVKFDDRILLVSSSSRLVVAMIPRYRLLP